MTRAAELASAFGLLTRMPVGHLAPEGTDHARAVWAYPVAGAVLGGFGGCIYAATIGIGLPPALASVWVLAASALATGALHEDGLADTADGFGGGRTRERRLEIMRDSRIGSYGALALVLTFAIRGAAIAAIADPWRVLAALVVAGSLGRAAILLVLRVAKPARTDGLAAALASVPPGAIAAGCAMAIGIAIALLPISRVLLAIALIVIAALALARLAKNRIGGYTGDILGATEIAAECLVLSLLAR